MIAIQTKFIPATNTRAAKIKAYTCNGHKAVVSIDYALDDVQRHAKAVSALIEKEMLYVPDFSTMVYGGTKEGYVFCFTQSTVTMPS